MKISNRLQDLAPSQTDAFSAKARILKTKGLDVVDFGLGEPDFNTPDNIGEAGVKAIREGFTRYTSPGGITKLKEAIREKLFRDNGLEYDLDEVTAACGAKQALFNVFMGILNPGDEFIIPAPYWVSYPNQIQLADGKMVVIPTKQENDYQISLEDLKKATSKRTVGILINTPNNPTGAVYNQRTLETIADWAVEGDYIVISDEINEKFIYDGHKHISIASLGKEIFERTIVINGVSKTYAMTGWRIGYAAGQRELISAIERLVSHSTSQPSSISQKAAIEALLGDQKSVEEMRMVYD
jgi:aspartate aminotransferase